MASHIIVDIEVRDRFAPALTELLIGCHFLDELCKETEMTIISTNIKKFSPHPDYKEHYPNGGGYTALKLLCESHVSIHTYPENRIASVDLFTCKCLDDAVVRKMFYKLVYHFFESSAHLSYRHIKRRK